MSGSLTDEILTELAQAIEIPDGAYEAADGRYQDLGGWLNDDSKSQSARYQPLVSPQGSFRLGTVTRLWKRDDYDLDVALNLQEGITTKSVTQYQLKQLVGTDLNLYRAERQIQEKLEEKHRCWRLKYQDQLQFHIDTVPCIPQAGDVKAIIQERIIQAGTGPLLAHDIASYAAAITDDRHVSYQRISDDWYTSNPEGYARWFESRMKMARGLLESRALQARVGHIEDLPAYRWRTPLQMAIQILKRHRDIMYERDLDRKPISIIITTLAAQAYRGAFELSATLEEILRNMQVDYVSPQILNPVDPRENFADRWNTPDGRRLQLKENFHAWLKQAQRDLGMLLSASDYGVLREHAQKRFGVFVKESAYGRPTANQSPAIHVIRDAPPKPWRR
jgi:hypothetical protein